MSDNNPRLGKKNGASRLAEALTKIHKIPTPKEAFQIVDEYKEHSRKAPLKKSAKGLGDLDA